MKINRILAVVMALLLCVSALSACTGEKGADPAPGAETAAEGSDGASDAALPEANDPALLQAYRAVLEHIAANPGEYYEFVGSGDPAYTKFGLGDIDNDGVPELLVKFEDTAVAGMYMQTWKYDGSAAREYMKCAVATDFYKTGYAAQGSNHNQTRGSLWPYRLAQISADALVPIGSVYSEEKEIAGDLFPAENDSDGDGVIYYYTPEGGETQNMTQTEYDAFAAQYIPEDQKIEIEFLDMTEGNVDAVCG